MGKRSRKRTGPRGPVARSPVVADAPAYIVPSDRRSRKLGAPRAPWAPVPLTEAGVLVGMALCVIGFARGGNGTGPFLLGGFGLISVFGLELAIREHLAAYRSHSSLLAGAVAVFLVAPLFFLTRLRYEVLLVCLVVFFACAFLLWRRLFMARSGGLGFRA